MTAGYILAAGNDVISFQAMAKWLLALTSIIPAI
jgi:hypothetical protein